MMFQQKTLDQLVLTPLPGGLSKAALFRFEFEGNSYVLRRLPCQSSDVERKV